MHCLHKSVLTNNRKRVNTSVSAGIAARGAAVMACIDLGGVPEHLDLADLAEFFKSVRGNRCTLSWIAACVASKAPAGHRVVVSIVELAVLVAAQGFTTARLIRSIGCDQVLKQQGTRRCSSCCVSTQDITVHCSSQRHMRRSSVASCNGETANLLLKGPGC